MWKAGRPSLIPIGGSKGRLVMRGGEGFSLLSKCKLYNLQVMNGKTLALGSWSGFKVVDLRVVQCTWEVIHLCSEHSGTRVF